VPSYRLAGGAEDQIDRIILESARQWGIEAAARYHRLMLSAFMALGDSPALLGSRDLPGMPGIRVFPLRLGRRFVDEDRRVGQPRHIVVYRTAPDGVVEVLGVAHDRMLLPRAGRQMRRKADS
jgi:toxin ParE1/3/4